MTKDAFLQLLAAELADLPAEERQAALDYYTEYLDEAGPEADAFALLGSPADVAATIRAGHTGGDWAAGYTPEKGKGGYGTCFGDDAGPSQPADQPQPIYQRDQGPVGQSRPKGLPGPLLIILLVCALPLLISLAAGLLGMVVGIGGAVLGIAAAGIGLAVGAVALLVVSVPLLGISFGTGLVNVGLALLLAAGGMLLLALTGWCFTKAIPALYRGCCQAVDYIKRKVGIT